MISLMKAAEKLGIRVGSGREEFYLQRKSLPGSPWMVPVEALSSEAVRIGCVVRFPGI